MLWLLVPATALHVLAAIFWAGSTLVLARTGALSVESLARPQLGAATVAILFGALLWYVNHRGAAGAGEHILAAGMASAMLAVILQATALPQVRALAAAVAAHADEKAVTLRRLLAARQRIAAPLLALAVIAMVSWRYF